MTYGMLVIHEKNLYRFIRIVTRKGKPTLAVIRPLGTGYEADKLVRYIELKKV